MKRIFLLLIFIPFLGLGQTTNCVAINNFTYIGGIGTCCYYEYLDTTTWTAADSICISNGGNLVAINSLQESDSLNLLLGNNNTGGNQHWINLIDGSTSWENGDPLLFTNYDVSYNVLSGDYMFLQNNGFWDNSPNNGSQSNNGIYPLMEICQTISIYGCTDSLSNNYNPLAIIDDSSCCYVNIVQNDTTICLGDSITLDVNLPTLCTPFNNISWDQSYYEDFSDGLAQGWYYVNGAVGGQGHSVVNGDDVWKQYSDWNHFRKTISNYPDPIGLAFETRVKGLGSSSTPLTVSFGFGAIASNWNYVTVEGYTVTLNNYPFWGDTTGLYLYNTPPAACVFAYQSNNWHTYRIEEVGDNYRFFVDGVLIIEECNIDTSGFGDQMWFHSNSSSWTSYDKVHIDYIKIERASYTSSPSSSSVLWSTGDTTASITVSPSQTTTYYVAQTQNGVSCSDSVTVTVLPTTSDTSYILACNSYTWNDSTYTQSGTYSYNGIYANNYSMNFDGSGSGNVVSFNNQVIPTNGSFTISFWAFPNSSSGIQEFMHQNSWISPGNAFYIGLNGTQIRCGDTWQSTSANVIVNKWQYISVVRHYNSHVDIYIDGILMASKSSDITISSANDNLRFGCQYSGTLVENYNGYLDAVEIWNFPLSSQQIMDYMNCSPFGNETGLLGFWNFEEGTGTTAYDQTSNGNDGTINGATYDSNVPAQSCSLTNANGCDSTAVLNLTISNTDSTSTYTNVAECDSFIWVLNGQTYSTSQIDTIQSINAGCTHIDSLDLTINNSTSSLTSITECDSYTWPVNGTTYTTSGVYTSTSTNAAGCTHIDSLDLTINSYIVNIIDTACGEYLWDGVIYDTTGSYTNSYTSVLGCDSTVNLALTVFEDSSVTYITACDSAIWNGVWYYNDTIVTDTGFTTSYSFGGASSSATSSGKEGNIWYFGEYAGLDFNSGSPVALTNGQLVTQEGCASISDNNGDLLFYTDGMTVYNKNHTIMPNGTGLLGNNSSTQSAIIVKKPGSTTIYYLFSVDGNSGNGGGLNYSEVDMTLDGGLGDINTNKNIPLIPMTCEKVTAIKHQNGSDFWIISRLENSNTYHSFLLTTAGINMTPSISNIGPIHNYTGGYLRGSPDGSKIAAVFMWSPNPIELYDFDNSTGMLSNLVLINTNHTYYGVEFSPNGNILYTSEEFGGEVWQLDLLAGSAVDIANSEIFLGTSINLVSGALQLAPDGKIYVANNSASNLSVINNPNIVGNGCNFNPVALDLSLGGTHNGVCKFGLPTFYSSIFIVPPSGCDSVATAIITINQSTSTYSNVIECDSYTWLVNGTTYTTGGTYTVISTNAAGCTHVDSLDLTINSYIVNIIDTACGEYVWDGVMYYTSGTYTNIFTAINGCDSTVNLTLTIFEDSSVTYITACDSAIWNGVWYYNDTIVTDTGLTTTNSFGGASSSATSSGKEGNIWYFGQNAGLDFNSGVPVALTNGQLNTNEGCASISDDNGDLLFYTDGMVVYNKNHTIMPNGTGLLGHSSSTQSAIIVKKPTSSTIYYLFTVNGASGGGGGLHYSEVDMTLDGGLGDINGSKNIMLIPNTCEKITAITHQNGSDFWIISRLENSNTYNAYLLTSIGVSTTPIVTNIGAILNQTGGYLRGSPDGSKIAAVFSWSNVPIELYDFNNSTGILSNLVSINTNQYEYGVEFSTSGDILYTGAEAAGGVYQYDLLAGSAVDIGNSEILLGFSSGHALQIGPDGKIYAATYGSSSLGRINNPDILGLGCSYIPNSVDLNGKSSTAGLPTFYSSIFNSPPSGCDSVATAIITINQSTSSTDTQVHCDTFMWINGTTYLASNNTDTVMYTNAAGCDSTVTLNLTINNSTSASMNATACDSYTWSIDGLTYTTSGVYTSPSTNAAGCTHIDSLDLTINDSTSTYTNEIECDSFIWALNGKTYSTSQIDTIQSTNTAGCIHIDSLDLTINYSTSAYTNEIECDSFIWALNGQTYYTSVIDTIQSINAAGCIHIDSLDLTIYPAINISAIITDELCVNYFDGAIDINVTGGFGAFSFNWTGANSFLNVSEDINNLLLGNYNLTITDNSSLCTKDTSFVINPGFDMQLTTSSTNISCYDTADGTIDITPINLISPVYIWSDISTSLEDRINLIAGIYYLQINDNNCYVKDTFILTQPDSLFLIAQQTNTTCSNGTNGYISVQVSGGIPSYIYSWSNGDNDSLNDLVSAGIYDLDVYDANGCLLEETFEILPYTVNVNSIINNIACFADSTGSIDLTISGGFPIYTYLWFDNSTNEDIYNLPAGNFSCIVSDALGCTTNVSFTLTQEQELASIPTINNVSCFSGNDGSVSLSISGGVSPYNIDWFNVDENNMTEGNYLYEITDSSGCIYQDTVYVGQIDSLVVNSTVINLECPNFPTGEILIDVISGGVSPFSYSWIGPNLFTSSSEDISNLAAGVYILQITDTNNCQEADTFEVTQPTQLNQIVEITTSNYTGFNIACKGDNSGWINLEINGGYIPFTYAWDTGETTDSISNLYAGNYNVTVIDSLGCLINYSFNLLEPPTVVSGVITATTDYNNYDIRCYGNKDGAIEEIVTGGVGNYTYQWSNGYSSDSIFNLSSGYYEVIVYDNNGCLWMDSITLTQPDSLVLSILLATDTCEREVGYAEASLFGGVPPYTYLWSSGDTTIAIYDLAEGIHEVVTLDKNLCQISNVAVIENLPSPTIDFKRLPKHKRFYDQMDHPFVFVDVSDAYWQNVVDWQWDFGDNTFGEDSIVFHSYAEAGEYTILLAIGTQYNCWDTISKKILIDEYDIFIPNAFTPLTADVLNDEFKAYGYGIVNYTMKIYNKWGEVIFESNDINRGWDGTIGDGEHIAPIGVYVYFIEVENIYGAVIIYTDALKLLR